MLAAGLLKSICLVDLRKALYLNTGAARRKQNNQLQLRALFTGIVQGTAAVLDVKTLPAFRQLQIRLPHLDGVQIGASIAINGVCLTVTGADPAASSVSFDVIEETLRRTNLGTLSNGSTVNFERSARMGDEIGGHNVAGHIHSTAGVTALEQTPNNLRMVFQVPQEWIKYILPKGFVAVDGISLTVGEVTEDSFCVYLIPETLRATTLGTRRVGEHVNIEIEQQTQTTVDTVERYLSKNLALPAQANAQPASALLA
ncbi:hypothetical protein WJX73_002536 [Symbiochloris irregularis]|uniref:Lumazine-binding domain-containing protein n=1 Tax=Symbiochloris irregularis TaxID=706552 RepID=A0AAW1PL24_9CHLO